MGTAALALLHLAAFGNMAYWLWIFYDHSVDSPTMFWLPLGLPCSVCIAQYIDKDMNALKTEVNKLADAKYDYKKL